MFANFGETIDNAFGIGVDEEERVKRDRIRRYQEAMRRAQGYGVPSSTAGIQSQMGALHAAGGAHLQGAANQAMSAIQRENESRVAQLREARRMEHEKEMLRIAEEAEMKRAEMMLKRLESQQGLPPGVISRLYIDGRGNRTFKTAR